MADFFSAGGVDQNSRNTQNQSQQSTNTFGNLAAFERGFPELYQPSQAEAPFLGAIQGLPFTSRYTPVQAQGIQSIQSAMNPYGSALDFAMRNWGNYFPGGGNAMQQFDTLPGYMRDQAIQSTGGDPYTPINTIRALLDAGVDPRALQTIQTLLASAMSGPSQLETQGLGTMRGRTDSGALTGAAERYMREIGEPSARAASVAGGMGGVRGGAFQEGLARESARMALPIAQLIQQAQGELGAAEMGVGAGLESRRANLATLLETIRQGQVAERAGLANQLFGMRNTMDSRQAQLAQILFGMGGADSRMSDLGLLTAAQGAAAMPRLGGLQDMLRQQQLAMLQRGGTQSGSTAGAGSMSQTQPFTVGNLISPLTTVAAASLLNSGGGMTGNGANGLLSGLGSSVSNVYYDTLNSLYGSGDATSAILASGL